MSKMYRSASCSNVSAGAGIADPRPRRTARAGHAWAPLAGRLEQYYLLASALTVAAGTSEIQRGIIAGRGLGLPRG